MRLARAKDMVIGKPIEWLCLGQDSGMLKHALDVVL